MCRVRSGATGTGDCIMSQPETGDDDRFRVRPSKPRQRGDTFIAKVLRQTARPLASLAGAQDHRPAPARAWGAAIRRRASRASR
jgi:hypothetical protein